MKKILFLFLMLPLISYGQDIDSIKSLSPKEGLFYALMYYEIAEPHIVYAQAVLETGHFKSILCTKYGNLFGIFDGKNKKYKHYNHWIESVEDYKNKIQNRYKNGDYFEFLERIHYASDSNYIKKIKILSENYIQYD